MRSEERRDVVVAFGFLAAFVGSHAILETGRDSLFLSRIPAAQLPFMMTAIAVLSLLVNSLQDTLSRMRARRTLGVMALFAGVFTAAVWALLGSLGNAGLYILYVWSGVVATLVLLRFWTLMGDLFSVTQAKRLFGLISTGAVVGAIVGSSVATALAGRIPTRTFVLMGGVGFATSAFIPALFTRAADAGAPAGGGDKTWFGSVVDSAGFVTRHPYAMRVALLTGAASTALGLADFAFRSTVAREVSAAHLTQVLATLALALNVLSFVVQLASASILRRLPLPWVLAILPSLLVSGGVWLLAGGGLFAAYALKGADGSLRYSLHKTASELLHLPLSESERKNAKAFLEVVANRGGQVVAAALALAVAASASEGDILAGLVVGLSIAWCALAVLLRSHYVALFRANLVSGRRRTFDEYPDLDVASLETLLESLDDESDAKVVAALAILEREHKAHVVPTLILYHPSEDVVVAALRMFATARRRVALHAIGHLLRHPSARIRAEAVAARAVIDPDEKLAQRLEREESPEVRAALLATLASSGELTAEEARARLAEIVESGSVESRTVVAEIIGWRRFQPLEPVLVALASAAELDVRRAAVRGLGALRTPTAAAAVVPLLADEGCKRLARGALAEADDVGFAAALAALADPGTDKPVRWELPRALAQIDPDRSARALMETLAGESDGMVRYRALGALLWIRRHRPDIRLDARLLDEEIRGTLSRAYRYLDRQLILQRGARESTDRSTPGHALLVDMLRDKRQNAIARLFRLLALRWPKHPFLDILRSIEASDRHGRAGAIELMENILPAPLRVAVGGLVDDIDDDARLASGSGFHEPLGVPYEVLLEQLLDSSSEVVRDLTAYHVAELRLVSLKPTLAALAAQGKDTADVTRALEILSGAPSLRLTPVPSGVLVAG